VYITFKILKFHNSKTGWSSAANRQPASLRLPEKYHFEQTMYLVSSRH